MEVISMTPSFLKINIPNCQWTKFQLTEYTGKIKYMQMYVFYLNRYRITHSTKWLLYEIISKYKLVVVELEMELFQ